MASPGSRFVYRTATSMDGFLADSENSLEWLFASPYDAGQPDRHHAFYATIGAVVLGSTTYEWLLAHEDLIAEPGKWHQIFEGRPSFVFTTRELPTPEGADVRFRSGPIDPTLGEIIAAADGRSVWILGGGGLAAPFDAAGALDAIELAIAPVTLGGGAPLLAGRIGADRLQLVSVRQEAQFVAADYAVRRPGAP